MNSILKSFMEFLKKQETDAISKILFAESKLKRIDFLKVMASLDKNKIVNKIFIECIKWSLLISSISIIDIQNIYFSIFIMIALIVFIRITYKQIQVFLKEKRIIDTKKRIFFNNDIYDRKQRMTVNRILLKLIFNFVIISMYIIYCIFILLPPENIKYVHTTFINIIGCFSIFYVSARIFIHLYMRFYNTIILILVLLLTNPIFFIGFSLCIIDLIKKSLHCEPLFHNNLERILYFFLEVGLQYEIAIGSIIYSLLLQIMYACNQPVYKLERSRLALELITGFFGIISVIGVIYSKEIAENVFYYMNNNSNFGKSFFEYTTQLHYDEMNTLAGFTNFYDKTFKLNLVPFSVGSTIALIIFKCRESLAKTKANAYFQKLTMSNEHFTLEQNLNLLRESIYYGGGNIKNSISSHTYLRFLTLKYLTDYSKNKGEYNVKLTTLKKRFDRRVKKAKSP